MSVLYFFEMYKLFYNVGTILLKRISLKQTRLLRKTQETRESISFLFELQWNLS